MLQCYPALKNVSSNDIKKISIKSMTGTAIVEEEEDLGKIWSKVRKFQQIKKSNPSIIYFISSDGMLKN